jgi:hypothetical protein
MISVQNNLVSGVYFPDPVQGTIELPQWLVNIKDERAIRRMMFIRQLGLKAYLDFPGAIHTRYSHALGTMHLAGRMTDQLSVKMKNKGIISQNLQSNKNNLIAAGFFHDIGHAPFSHAADYVMKVITGKSHEQMCEDILKDKIPSDVERWGINKSAVIELINPKTHEYPFLSQIINGPLDCDKLDYLLRDAYHVGLKYSFDLDQFLRSYRVIGEEETIKKCVLGLDLTQQAIVTAELFITIWKSMYDLVYLVQQSRIAEKMLEKAFLLHKDEDQIKNLFEINTFIEGNDENMLVQLKNLGPEIEKFLAMDDPRRIYNLVLEKELSRRNYKMTAEFLAKLEDADKLSDELSIKLADELKQEKYSVICDIVRTKAPKEIYLDNSNMNKEEIELRMKSDIVEVIKQKNVLKVYIEPTVLKNIDNKSVKKVVKNLVEESEV